MTSEHDCDRNLICAPRNALTRNCNRGEVMKTLMSCFPILLATLKKQPFVLQCETTGSAKNIRDLWIARL